MAKAGGFLFQIGYFFYSRTPIGYYYHLRDIKKAKQTLGDASHSDLMPFVYGNLTILPIPMLLDNYAYLISDTKNNKSVLIDPGHAEAVQKVLTEKNIQPDAILITHKHWDHSGGNKELRHVFPDVLVYGGSADSVPDSTHHLKDGDELEFGSLKFHILLTPGHTVGHIVYILDGSKFATQDSLFSGDALFLAGSGRNFEASPLIMLRSLDKLMTLKNSTLLWPGHEYALDNLEFATHIDPDNDQAQKKLNWVKERRRKNLCTCPSTLGEEKTYNPFLRTSVEPVLQTIGMSGEGDFTEGLRARALELIREAKDQFKYRL